MLLLGKKKLTDWLSFLVSGFIIFGYVITPQGASANISESQNSKAELQKRKKELSKELKKASEEVHKEAKNNDALDKEIYVLQEQIDVSNAYINAIDKEILNMEEQISEIRKNMKDKIGVLKKSLSSIYVAGDTSTIDIVLGAKDFEDFLDKVDVVRSVSQTIQKLIDDLQEDLVKIEKKEQEITSNKQEKEKEKQNLEKSRENLQGLFDQSEKLLSELEDSEKQAKLKVDQNDAEIKAIDAQIQKYYEEQKRREEEAKKRNQQGKSSAEDKPVVYKGGFAWPVPGYYQITSGFNDTESRSHVHGAIDIAGRGVYGANIVASGAGKVIIANTDGRGGGYGNYVVIDHGNRISTLYGHMSTVSVRAGQTVSAGQKIGNVGNTGFSTGPHLHFEYRVSGIRKNPREILSF